MKNAPTNIAECANLALVIRGLKARGKTKEADESFEVLTHALLDLAALEPPTGSKEKELWEKFDREQPKPHVFS
jgi:hypothetical protein